MILACALLVAMTASVQSANAEKKGYEFTDTKEVKITPVKDQSRSGTCWCFSTNSFLESEILRAGGKEVHLSEMWVVRHTIMEKAEKYVRMHGHINFAEGGASHDVIEMIKRYGIVPFEAYPGLNYGTEKPDFHEMSAVLKNYITGVLDAYNKSRKPLSTAWKRGFNAILDEYFGELPERFTYEGKEYTAKEFAAQLPIDMDNYIDITSFTHHPFYEKFIIEIPDNWMWGEVYNVPMEEMMEIIDYALANDYAVAWGTDVSEQGFSRDKSIGVIPETNLENLAGTEAERWGALTAAERAAAAYSFDGPRTERKITQQMRQEAFDNFETTDDHGMVIMGTATDQQGNHYYKVLNSWGTNNPYKGFWYFSKPFAAYKTTNIMVNKKALPKHIAKKLGL